jgi:prepilin-type N-terminal cleavage/methylation domain-containing protein
MRTRISGRRQAFSLIELVVVIVIIGIIAAMAIPRMSRGSAGAAKAAVIGNLSMIRSAIQHYSGEHNGALPGATIVNQLTLYSDLNGGTNAAKSSTYKFGPYLLAIPPCPVGENAGNAAVLIDPATDNAAPAVNAASAGGEGWCYKPFTGVFVPNTATTDPETTNGWNTF